MNLHLERACVLLDQSRLDLAEKELRLALAEAPNDALAHALLAQCLCERQELMEATDEAQTAVGLNPELADAYHILARILLERSRPQEALAAINEALRLQPHWASHYAALAAIYLAERDWPAALDAAEQGLRQDAEHIGCNNLRAMALVKLGRRDEAGQTIAGTLARDPEDAFSHANQGWLLLHQGNSLKAREHFREALRLDPTLGYARAGMVEALKSKNFLYAMMLRYFLWMSRLSRRAQWAVVLIGYFAYQGLAALVKTNPGLKPWVVPVMIAYFGFAVLTWVAVPLFNLLLRLDRFGRHALSREQVIASNWVGALLGLALIALAVWLATGDIMAEVAAIYFGLLLPPTSAVFTCPSGWPRKTMMMYTIGVAAIGGFFILLGYLDVGLAPPVVRDLSYGLAVAFVWGCILSLLLANFLMQVRPRR
jgi:Tfp pilus assembly protein PilF